MTIQEEQHIPLAEKLRYWRSEGSLMLDPKATPSRTPNKAPPAKAQPNWEAGIVTEKRPGGTEMPMIDAQTLNPIRVKAYSERRSHYEAERRKLHNAPPSA